MSWSVVYDSMSAFRAHAPTFSSIGVAEDQREAAWDAALLIVLSQAVGADDMHDFMVSAYGHSNPKHEPAEGYANDTITVTVSQKLAAKPAAAPAPT